MSVLSVVRGPHPIFKKKSALVSEFTPALKTWLDQFEHTLHATGALGLAAPMVGVSQHIIVVNTSQGVQASSLVMINPSVVEHSAEKTTQEESSLSFPGVAVPVARYHAVSVQYQDVQGVQHVFKAEGLLARVIQHEIDYLHGKTPLDYLPSLKRNLVLKKLEKEKAQSHHHVHGPHCRH
jgi:peptide deformylase